MFEFIPENDPLPDNILQVIELQKETYNAAIDEAVKEAKKLMSPFDTIEAIKELKQ